MPPKLTAAQLLAQHEFIELLIEKYRARDYLYHKGSKDYCNKQLKTRGYEDIVTELQTENPVLYRNVTVKVVKQKIAQLRKSFGSQLKRYDELHRSGAASSTDVIKWPYFKLLFFLKGNLRVKKGSTASNVTDEAKEVAAESSSDSDEDGLASSELSNTPSCSTARSFTQTTSYRAGKLPNLKFAISPQKKPAAAPAARGDGSQNYIVENIDGITYLVPVKMDREKNGENQQQQEVEDQELPGSQNRENIEIDLESLSSASASQKALSKSFTPCTAETSKKASVSPKLLPQAISFENHSSEDAAWFSNVLEGDSYAEDILGNPPQTPSPASQSRVNSKQYSKNSDSKKRVGNFDEPEEFKKGLRTMSQAAATISQVLVERSKKSQEAPKARCLDFLSDEIEKLSKKKKAQVIMTVTNIVMEAVMDESE